MSREIEVWADWRELGAPTLMGHLRSTPSRGKEVFSFSYDRAWLDGGHSRQLDPDLRFFSGPQYPSAADRPNFSIFLDSSPDRWGRLLMQRREAAQAREEGRPTHRLQETDYLLAPFFRLKPADAGSILQQVKHAVKSWQSHAKTLGIARAEQEIMAAALEV